MFIVEYTLTPEDGWVGIPAPQHWYTEAGLFAPAAEFASEAAATAFMLEAQPVIQRDLGRSVPVRVSRVDEHGNILNLVSSLEVN